MTTREEAEKIIRESVCIHGPGAECSEYHEQDIIDRIDEALRNERERCAVIAETCHPQPCICQTCLIRAEAGAAIRRTIREGR